MPPHCDSMDGPVVSAARRALEARDVDLVLPYVQASGEAEVLAAYELAAAALRGDPVVDEIAEMYFFETVVRVHRAGEGAPYTGLKPAGLSTGPVIPVAEQAVESGDPTRLLDTLGRKLEHEIRLRLAEVVRLRPGPGASVEAVRDHVEATLGLQVWSHHLYGAMAAGAHGGGEAAAHDHG